MNGVHFGLPLAVVFSSILLSIIVVNQVIFFILSALHVSLIPPKCVDFCIRTISSSFTLSVDEILRVLLQHHISKASTLAFLVLKIVYILAPYSATIYTDVLIRVLLVSICMAFVVRRFFFL